MTEPESRPPVWGGITEPMTVLTNVVLATVAFVLGARLVYAAAADGRAASGWMGLGLVATAIAASFGAAAHGIDPRVDPVQRDRCWRAALYVTGLVSACTIASVAYFAATRGLRTMLLGAAAVKFLVYVVRIARRPEFRIAAVDYGLSLAVLLVGAAYLAVRSRADAAWWLAAGVGVSLVAGLVQGCRVAPHRQFNHNDLYHVIQIGGLYLFYRGATLLVDR